MANPSQDSIDYYRKREQHEISQAESAPSTAIRDIHLEMAVNYRKIIEQLESAWRQSGEDSLSGTVSSGG